MLDDKTTIFADNVAIIQSQDSNSLAHFVITAQDFAAFTGDRTKTVIVDPREAPESSRWASIRKLFGTWVEHGDEDKELEDLYLSRQIHSSQPDQDE